MADSRFYEKTGPFTLPDLAEKVDGEIRGTVPKDFLLYDIRPLGEAQNNHLTCYHNPKYLKALQETKAGACLISPEFMFQAPDSLPLLVVDRPYRAYGKLLEIFYPASSFIPGISPHAIISPSAKIEPGCRIEDFVVIGDNVEIGEGTYVGPFTYVGPGVRLGKRCHLQSHVAVEHALIGNEVRLKTGAKIGQKGFGFDMDDQGHVDIPQLGRVILEDRVEVGANTTIDRGSNGDTHIGRGCRIDNLVQIAHNVVLGDHCVLVAQVGIAGSSRLGKFVVAAGQVGIAGHLTIGDGARIAAKSGLMRDVLPGETVAGIPAVPAREHFRQVATLARLSQKKNRRGL